MKFLFFVVNFFYYKIRLDKKCSSMNIRNEKTFLGHFLGYNFIFNAHLKKYYLSLNMYSKIYLEQIMNKPTIQFCKIV